VTTVLVIVCVKLLVLCLHWPALLARVGSWIVWLANLVGRVFVRDEVVDPVLPQARVVRR
jgi:hypothetical protein